MLQKTIKIIIKASKVSKRNMNKSLSIVKKIYENVENCIFKDIDWSREKHLRNDFLVEYFLLSGAIF